MAESWAKNSLLGTTLPLPETRKRGFSGKEEGVARKVAGTPLFSGGLSSYTKNDILNCKTLEPPASAKSFNGECSLFSTKKPFNAGSYLSKPFDAGLFSTKSLSDNKPLATSSDAYPSLSLKSAYSKPLTTSNRFGKTNVSFHCDNESLVAEGPRSLLPKQEEVQDTNLTLEDKETLMRNQEKEENIVDEIDFPSYKNFDVEVAEKKPEDSAQTLRKIEAAMLDKEKVKKIENLKSCR